MRCKFLAYGKSGDNHGVDFERELPSIPHTGDRIFPSYDGNCYIVGAIVLASNDEVHLFCTIDYDSSPYARAV